LQKSDEVLEVARKSVEFILRNKPNDPHGLWPASFSREGNPIGDSRPEIYGNLFIAEGLAEYAHATGNREYWDTAKDIVTHAVEIYDRPDYCPVIGQTYLGPDALPFPGARILGHWMVLIRVATQMLQMHDDPRLEDLVARSVKAIMDHHHNPRFDLTNELVNHDLSRPENDYEQLVYTGHAIETLWMVMDEAVRIRDRSLFEGAARRFRRHVEVAWDDVYGGVFRNLQHVDRNIWSLDKVLWAQEEVLIGALMVIEHLGLDWANDMFAKMYEYVMEKYPLEKHGHSLWILGADRKVTYEKNASRVGNYHHPRHLMLNQLSIERIMARRGAVSGVFG
jgi:mannose/cellobiose epimerase-like protein (N-acyl-D-glucosamine 2-epimerase family)